MRVRRGLGVSGGAGRASGTHLVLQEQGSELALGPEVHGVGQEFGGNRVDAKEVADKHHALDFLKWTQKGLGVSFKRKPGGAALRRRCTA